MMKCASVDCENEAAYFPVLVVTPDGKHHALAELNELPVCTSCKKKMTVDNMVNDEGWKKIAGAFLAIGKAEPRRELTTLEWRRL